MACKIASAAGALSVIAIDPMEHKRKLALGYGATAAFDPTEDGYKKKLLAITRESSGVDVVLEMSGSRSGIRDTFDLVRPGGEVALLGIPPSDVSMNLSDSIIFKAITVRGINGRLMFETWYQCEQFLLQNKLDLRPLITHQFSFQNFKDAFGVLERGEAVKVLFDWDQMTRSNPLAYLSEQLDGWREAGTLQRLRQLESPCEPVSRFDGREVINLASNNYLGLANHPKLVEAASDAARRYGAGSGAVRTISGTMDIHMELERRIAAFKNVEACLVFQSGFTANAGTVSAC